VQIISAVICFISTVDARPKTLRPGPPAPLKSTGNKVVTFADSLSGNFSVKRTSLQWTSQGDDGNYVTQVGNDLVFANIVTGKNSTFVAASDIDGAAADYYGFLIQPSG
jgi:dipeptidyl-peptidase-4